MAKPKTMVAHIGVGVSSIWSKKFNVPVAQAIKTGRLIMPKTIKAAILWNKLEKNFIMCFFSQLIMGNDI